MKQRRRIYYSEAQKSMMWDRWQRGESIKSIARSFDRYHSSIRGIFERTGGIRPPARRRCARSLTLAEREEISRGIVAGWSTRSIAVSLGRAPSTVSRELQRNGGRRAYRASGADQAAWDRAHRPKACKLALNRPLARIVAIRLKQHWSPEQISGWLKLTYPADEHFQVSHETIYRSLYIQARGALMISAYPYPTHYPSEMAPPEGPYGRFSGVRWDCVGGCLFSFFCCNREGLGIQGDLFRRYGTFWFRIIYRGFQFSSRRRQKKFSV